MTEAQTLEQQQNPLNQFTFKEFNVCICQRILLLEANVELVNKDRPWLSECLIKGHCKLK